MGFADAAVSLAAGDLCDYLSFVTGNIGGNAMQYHSWGGFAILALLLFRLVWGFVGSRESRFVTFVYGPSTVIRYARTLLHRNSARHLGHNPLGGWSIIALLFTLLVQAATGLFANDDILTEGPLFDWVGKATSDWLTKVHKLNQQVIIALIGLHVAAVLFYFFYKRQDLIWLMDDWLLQKDGKIYPQFNTGRDLMHDGRWGNVPTINGKFRPEFTVKPGERIRLRLINGSNARIFSPHIEGLSADVIAVDGKPVTQIFPFDGFVLSPGNRIDLDIVISEHVGGNIFAVEDRFTRKAFGFVPEHPGIWMTHCHIQEHAEAGMMTTIEVKN